MPLHAACCNYIYTRWSSPNLFPQLCQASLPQNTKKSCMKNPNSEKYCLAAELQSGSGNFMVNTEFCMTLMGHRMVPHFEPKHTQ